MQAGFLFTTTATASAEKLFGNQDFHFKFALFIEIYELYFDFKPSNRRCRDMLDIVVMFMSCLHLVYNFFSRRSYY